MQNKCRKFKMQLCVLLQCLVKFLPAVHLMSDFDPFFRADASLSWIDVFFVLVFFYNFQTVPQVFSSGCGP